jgi:predicted deacylase
VLIAAALLIVAAATAGCGLSLGFSVEQRDIVAHQYGDGPKKVLLIGGLHTDSEDNSRVLLEQISAVLATRPDLVPSSITLYVVPSANPDGSAHGLHTNARGVDLNRNWPADDWVTDACHPHTGCRPGLGGPQPLSEPETSALYQFIATIRPDVTVVWHSSGALVEANEVAGADVYGQAFAQAAGYAYIEEWTAYEITGQVIDALEQRLGLRALDIELSQCCTVTPEDYERNVQGLIALLQEVDSSRRPTSSPTRRATSTPAISFRRPTRTPTATRTPRNATRTPEPTSTPTATPTAG